MNILNKSLVTLLAAMLAIGATPAFQAANGQGEADGLVVVITPRDALGHEDALFVSAVGGYYLFDVQTFDAEGNDYLFTQWGAVALSIDPEGNAAPAGACAEPESTFCVWADGGSSAPTNALTLAIPASAVAWGAVLPANGVTINFVVVKDGDGNDLADGTGRYPSGNNNVATGTFVAQGDFASADLADESFSPLFLLDSQPDGMVAFNQPLLNPGFDAATSVEGDLGMFRSTASPWALFADGNNVTASMETLVSGGPQGTNAIRAVLNSNADTSLTLSQHLLKEELGSYWVLTNDVSVEFDVRFTGGSASQGAGANAHWNSAAGENCSEHDGTTIPSDGAWHHVVIAFGLPQDFAGECAGTSAVAGESVTDYFSISLGYNDADTVDIDNVELNGAQFVSGGQPTSLVSDISDSHSVHLLPLGGETEQGTVAFADGSTGYAYEVVVVDHTGATARVVDFGTEIGGQAFALRDENFIISGGDHATARFQGYPSNGGIVERVDGSVLLVAPGDLAGASVSPWFWGQVIDAPDWTDVSGAEGSTASGYFSTVKNTFAGTSAADQLDYHFTPVSLDAGASGIEFGAATTMDAACVAAPSTGCWAGEGQGITVSIDVSSLSEYLETGTVTVYSTNGDALASASVDLPANSVDVNVPAAAVSDAVASGQDTVWAGFHSARFANPAQDLDQIDFHNLVPTAGISLSVAGGVYTATADATDTDGDIVSFDWALTFVSDATPDADNATGFSLSGAAETFQFSLPDDGEYLLTLAVEDNQGGAASASQSLFLENLGPVTSISAPAFATLGTLTVTDSSADTDNGVIVSRDWTLTLPDATTVVPTSDANGATYDVTSEGTYVFDLVVKDDDGAISAASRTVVVDVTAPVTTVVASGDESNGYYVSGITLDISRVDTGDSGLLGTTVVLDGAPIAVQAGGDDFAVTVSGDGAHTVAVFSRDRAGNVESIQTFEFTIDATAPTASIQSPSAGGSLVASASGGVWFEGDQVAVDVVADDAGSGVSSVVFYLDGEGVAVDADGSDGYGTMLDTTGLATGEHFIDVVVFDNAGHIGVADTVSIVVVSTDVF